jgi:hypothetical protein
LEKEYRLLPLRYIPDEARMNENQANNFGLKLQEVSHVNRIKGYDQS